MSNDQQAIHDDSQALRRVEFRRDATGLLIQSRTCSGEYRVIHLEPADIERLRREIDG